MLLLTLSDITQAVILVSALTGSVLNARQHIAGFYFWIIANTVGFFLFCYSHLWLLALLYFCYTLIAVYGIVVWRAKT